MPFCPCLSERIRLVSDDNVFWICFHCPLMSAKYQGIPLKLKDKEW